MVEKVSSKIEVKVIFLVFDFSPQFGQKSELCSFLQEIQTIWIRPVDES